MHGVIVKPHNSNYRGHSYTIWVMKTGRVIMWNSKHISCTIITSEEYLQEQVQKGIGVIGGYFAQVTQREVNELPNHGQLALPQKCQ